MNSDYLDADAWSNTTSIDRDRKEDAALCDCGHRWYHHASGAYCGTVTVWGPPSPSDASAHIEHAGRNTTRCECDAYEAGS